MSLIVTTTNKTINKQIINLPYPYTLYSHPLWRSKGEGL